MPDRAFFDTNILIYAFSAGDPWQGVALKLMLNGGAIGVQTLNEFVSVATCKLKIPWTEVVARLGIIERLCDPAVPVTLSVHRRGLEISQTLSYHLHDSLMLAAALEASCTVFYSEDLQDGQSVGPLKIQNPFAMAK